MIYSNYIRSYYNMISQIDKMNNSVSAVSGIKNNSNNLLNDVLSYKKNDYLNNMKEYSKHKKESEEFNDEFREKFTKLKDSANKLKSYSSNSVFVKKYDNKTVEDQNKEIIDTVESFASNYNDAVKFLNNNSNKSQKISDLAQSYTNLFKYNKSTLSGIGVNINADGELTIDKDKLANAIKDNIDTVRNALGDSTSGIANKIYNKTTVAMVQTKELYPATKLQSDYVNKTYLYNPNNVSLLQSNQMHSSGVFLDILL